MRALHVEALALAACLTGCTAEPVPTVTTTAAAGADATHTESRMDSAKPDAIVDERIPAIDRNLPAHLETATFALG